MSSHLPYIIEACVENKVEAVKAAFNGAMQIELCTDLDSEGLTPCHSSVKACLDEIDIALKVMLRHRRGDFIYDTNDIAQLIAQLKLLKQFPLKSIVFGALTLKGQLDLELIQKIRDLAYPIGICVHKAIDKSSDILAATSSLIHVGGIQEILSSGGAPTAKEGIENLVEMKNICSNQILLIGAGSVTASNLSSLHQLVNLKAYHGRRIVGDL